MDNKLHQFETPDRRVRVPELINFFSKDVHSDNHIYAHKEYGMSEDGKRQTVIKPEEEIFRLLREESALL